MRQTGGGGAMVTDDEIIAGIQLLAETEGIFTEPAGGVTVAATKKLIERGALPRDESIVICITGNGYKTAEVMNGRGVDAGAHRSIARGLRGERRRAGRDVVGVGATTTTWSTGGREERNPIRTKSPSGPTSLFTRIL